MRTLAHRGCQAGSARLTITMEPLGDVASLETAWRDLAARAGSGFFLSWTWIGAWLGHLVEPPIVLKARDESGRLVGLALLARRTIYRRMMRVRQLLLHQTGDAAFDRIAIEHNGFLLDPAVAGREADLIAALADARARIGWDELVLGGVSAGLAIAAAPLVVEFDRRQAHFVVELDREESWLAGLSPNARRQLERATRRAETQGALTLDPASSGDEARAFLGELARLHAARWQARGQEGAFALPAVWQFHDRLIALGHAADEVEVLRGRAGDVLLGYLYQFRRDGVVSAYQSGIVPSDDNRDKPGLVLHRLAIERAVAMGDRRYDLLAGEARYKRSLGREAEMLVWCRAQAPSVGLALERWARRARAGLRQRATSAP